MLRRQAHSMSRSMRILRSAGISLLFAVLVISAFTTRLHASGTAKADLKELSKVSCLWLAVQKYKMEIVSLQQTVSVIIGITPEIFEQMLGNKPTFQM